MPELVIDIIEIIGTIAFAVSGALVAIGVGFDIFGVAFVGWITAVGGGIIRDLLIGSIPPTAFENFAMSVIAIVTALIVFGIIYVKKNYNMIRHRVEAINNVFDAIGLAAFSVMGAEITYASGFENNAFIVITLGMITGVGGGIFRDIFTDTTPYVFKKHVYALASIAGCVVYYLITHYFGQSMWNSVLPMALIVVLRLLATKFLWSLPKVEISENTLTESKQS